MKERKKEKEELQKWSISVQTQMEIDDFINKIMFEQIANSKIAEAQKRKERK